MNAAQYIVIGTYSHEQNSWIPNGDIRHHVSSHRNESSAWGAAEKAHYKLGGYNGSNRLANVMRRFAKLGSRKAATIPDHENTYKHAGYLYVECDFWSAHEIRWTRSGLVYQHKE